MFTKSARFYDALYHFKDYRAAVRRLHEIIQQHRPGASSLLDVACGTGKHVEELRNDYIAEGVDIDPGMLEIARARCPELKFHCADMTELDLGDQFDVVTCLFSSIGYVKTLDRMELAISSMARHLTQGGLLIVEPWFGPDTYWTDRITANYVDQPDLKIAWMYTSEREGALSRFNIHYLIGRPQGVEHITELHEMGLFSNEDYLTAFRKAGLTEVIHDRQGLFGRGMYIGKHDETQH